MVGTIAVVETHGLMAATITAAAVEITGIAGEIIAVAEITGTITETVAAEITGMTVAAIAVVVMIAVPGAVAAVTVILAQIVIAVAVQGRMLVKKHVRRFVRLFTIMVTMIQIKAVDVAKVFRLQPFLC